MRDEHHVNRLLGQKEVDIFLADGVTLVRGELLSITDHRVFVDARLVRNVYDPEGEEREGGGFVMFMAHKIDTIRPAQTEESVAEAPETPQEVVQQAISEIEGTGG